MAKGLKRVRKLTYPAKSNRFQTVSERIKYIRANMKPYMTLKQLAERARVPIETIVQIEAGHPKAMNMKLNTLRKIAHGLDCRIYINIASRPYPISTECQPLESGLPPLPKHSGKSTAQGRMLALLHGSSPWKTARPAKRRARRKATSEKPDLEAASSEQTAE